MEMEQYFRRFSSEIETLGDEPKVTERQFVEKAVSRAARRVRAIRAAAFAVPAAAVLAVLAFFAFRSGPEGIQDPAMHCIEEYKDGIRPLYDEIRLMENESQLCREMGISSTIDGLMASSDAFCSQLDGMDPGSRADIVRIYCSRQTECVASLYRECLAAYVGAGY